MRSGASAFSVEDKSQAREYFEGMLDDELSKEMTKSGGVGIADMLFNNLKRAYAAAEAEIDQEVQEPYEPLDLKG
jgi:Rod binding domain-containing protein